MAARTQIVLKRRKLTQKERRSNTYFALALLTLTAFCYSSNDDFMTKNLENAYNVGYYATQNYDAKYEDAKTKLGEQVIVKHTGSGADYVISNHRGSRIALDVNGTQKEYKNYYHEARKAPILFLGTE